MNKSDLIEALGDRVRCRHEHASKAVNAIFERISTALIADEPVELRGLFSFRTKIHAARTGRNPKTGESIEVSAKRLPVLRVSKTLRQKLSEGAGKQCE